MICTWLLLKQGEGKISLTGKKTCITEILRAIYLQRSVLANGDHLWVGENMREKGIFRHGT